MSEEHTDLSPQEWLSFADGGFLIDPPWTHPDPEFDELQSKARSGRRAELANGVPLAPPVRDNGIVI